MDLTIKHLAAIAIVCITLIAMAFLVTKCAHEDFMSMQQMEQPKNEKEGK